MVIFETPGCVVHTHTHTHTLYQKKLKGYLISAFLDTQKRMVVNRI